MDNSLDRRAGILQQKLSLLPPAFTQTPKTQNSDIELKPKKPGQKVKNTHKYKKEQNGVKNADTKENNEKKKPDRGLKRKLEVPADEEDDEIDWESVSVLDEEDGKENALGNGTKNNSNNSKPGKWTNGFRSSSESTKLDEIREKFHQRLEEFRAKRKASSHDPEKKKKKKLKKEEEKKRRKAAKGNQNKGGVSSEKEAEKNSSNPKEAESKRETSKIEMGDIQYGNFKFGEEGPQRKKKKPNVEVLLQKAETEKKKLEKLAGTEEGKELARQKKMEKAAQRAKGEKIKDDPELLKAALRKKRKAKVKSAKEWKDRKEKEQEEKMSRQKTRSENLKARSQGKHTGKKKFKPSRPGFEGKRSKFLNK